MNFNINNIASVIKAEILGLPTSEPIEYFSIDTRNLPFAKKTLFFALKGFKNDGHKFIPEAYRFGTRVFVVNDQYQPEISLEEAVFLKVDDPLTALQQLATQHRKSLKDTTVVGITGSNGKTIVKEWLANLLEQNISIGRSPGSYNSQIGVPLSLLSIKPANKIAFIEAGVSQKNEMDILANIIQPEIGILTGIGRAHEEGFKDEVEKIEEKLKLFASCSTIIFPGDVHNITAAVHRQYPEKDLISWGETEMSNLRILEISREKTITRIQVRAEGNNFQIILKALDSASIENAMTCLGFLYHIGAINTEIIQKFSQLEPLKNRLEIKNGIYNSLLLNDSYSADLSGFTVAYNFLLLNAVDRKKILILSDFAMQKEEKFNKTIQESLAGIINDQPIELLITIGTHLKDISDILNQEIQHQHYNDVEHFLRRFDRNTLSHSSILIKGSRNYTLEQIVNEFSVKQHQTFLEIDLAALTHNLNYFASLLDRKTKIMVMVKAAAYGAGSVEIASWLQNQRIDYLGVAYADEGVELRMNGIKLPIIVLNTDVQSFENIIKHRLEPEIFSVEQLGHFIQFLKNSTLNNYPIHLKIETGMNRLGFRPSEFDSLFNILKENASYIQVTSIFSHLTSSDDPKEDDFTRTQVERLVDFSSKFEREIAQKPLTHILNSSGILRFPNFRMDMVRLGIGLYGLTPDEDNPHGKLIHALTLKSVISQIKTIQAGESVSYGRIWKADKPTRVATIGLGYADGLRRDAGRNNVFLYINGKAAPILGNVCMDMCIVDISHIPEAQTGDEAVVFSPDFPISILAEKLNTIPYEVLTSISKRVQRVYLNS